MLWIGHRAGRLIAAGSVTWPALGALAALIPALWMWGFTVDDALISIRYARHLASGAGWRFDAGGPSTDGVTPLPWPLVLAPLASGDALVVLARAKLLGLAAWVLTGAALGHATGQVRAAPPWARAAALSVLALSVPAAAHAVSGMETAVATALATAAIVLPSRPWGSAVLAGLAASFRPELAPWAFALAAGLALAAGERPPRASLTGAVALGPFLACSLVRALAWGTPAPLALTAKPSDLSHGLAYVGAACVVTLAPFLVAAPRALWCDRRALAIVAAAIVHLGVLVLVGGDWMPYARLMVPIVPSLVYASVLASARAKRRATAVRAIGTVVLGLVLVARGGTSGRRVGADRAELVAEARVALAGVRRPAALDIGWLSAATEGDIVDLGGVTDPRIAVLPGGHTSKRVDAPLLFTLEPDALLLYAPHGLPAGRLADWARASFPRAVEGRLAADPAVAERFAPTAWLPLGEPAGERGRGPGGRPSGLADAGYVVLRLRARGD